MADEPTPGGRSRFGGPGILWVVLTAVISGVSTFVNLYAVHGTNSAAFVTARNGLVALMLAPMAVLVAVRARAARRPADWARLVAIGVVGGGIPFLLFFRGLQLASAAGGGISASFLYRTLFLMATVFSVVLLGERLRGRLLVAAGLLLGGNFLLLAWTGPVWTGGALYVLVATALWAVEYTISKRTLRDLSSWTVGLGRMGFGVAFLGGYLLATAQLGGVAALSGGQWAWVGISAAFLTAFVATWYAGLKLVPLSVAAPVLVLGFPITWLLSVTVQGAASSPLAVVGALAVGAGAVVAVGGTAWRETGLYLRGRWRRPTA